MTLRTCLVRSERGSTLIMVVFVIAILAVLLGAAFDYTTGTAIQTSRSQDQTAEQSLAEGVLEGTFAAWRIWIITYQNQPIDQYTKSANLKTMTDPVIAGFNNTLSASNSSYTVFSLSVVAVDRTDTAMDGTKVVPGPTPVPTPASFPSSTPAAQPDGHSTSSWTASPPTTPGWVGKAYTYRAKVTVTKWLNKAAGTRDGSRSFTVSRYFQTTDCSLFQAMMFFQNDLELNPGSNMTVSGVVATNANLFLSSHATLTLNNGVSFAGDSANAHPAAVHPGNAIYDTKNDKNGNPVYTGYFEGVTQTLYNTEENTPGGSWDSFNNPVYSQGKTAQLSGPVDALNPLGRSNDLPIDTTNDNASGTHEIIERPVPTSKTDPNPKANTTDPSDYMAHRLYNSAGLRIFLNRGSASPVTVYTPQSVLQPELNVAAPALLTTAIAATITLAPTTGTSTFWDTRENHPINVSTVDMSKLKPILDAYAGYNGVVYITDVTHMTATGETGADASGNDDAIRIKKGAQLPANGLTLVSDGAVYVQGDYNTGGTYNPKDDSLIAVPDSDSNGSSANYTVSGYAAKPASIIGDAVMMLSNNWQDSNSGGKLTARIATGTTYNAALVTGQMLTDNNAGTASGGAHNLPRFLENWTGKPCAYHGSMIELYPSKHFTGTWGTGQIYAAPNRYWYFENSYLTVPPPGNLRSTTYTRGRWVREVNPPVS